MPEFDREPNQRLNERIFHDDVNVTSPLLGDVIVSFRWRPIIEGGMINDIRASYSQEPDFILLGIINGTATFFPTLSVSTFLSRLYFLFRIQAFLSLAKNVTVPHFGFLARA